ARDVRVVPVPLAALLARRTGRSDDDPDHRCAVTSVGRRLPGHLCRTSNRIPIRGIAANHRERYLSARWPAPNLLMWRRGPPCSSTARMPLTGRWSPFVTT